MSEPTPHNQQAFVVLLYFRMNLVSSLDLIIFIAEDLALKSKSTDQLLSFDEGEVEWKALESVFNIIAGGDVPKDAFSDVKTQRYNIPILSNGIGDKANCRIRRTTLIFLNVFFKFS
jgi:hypothetical protein